jgi:CheY-like chemotaxis protein
MHGGTVSASSEGRGKGSVFTVDLPAADGATTSPAEVAPTTRATRGHGLRVLVVDDNTDAAAMLSEWLVDLGFDARAVHDGPAAIDAAETFAPYAVLLDIGLPVMDGFEVARRLRARPLARELQLIAITGYGQQVDRERTLREGFRAHLVKPVDLDALADLLGTLQQSERTGR